MSKKSSNFAPDFETRFDMTKNHVFCLLVMAVMALNGTCAYAKGSVADSSAYAWRLDEAALILDEKQMSDEGDTIYTGSLVRYFYTDSGFYTVQYPAMTKIKDTIEVARLINKTEYNRIGANGKHREKSYQIRIRGGNRTIRFIDSIPQIDPFADTIIAPLEYRDYAYDTYRNVYDGEGNLLRQIRNYDYTRYYIDTDSLVKFIEKYKDSTEFPISEFNQIPYEVFDRNVLIQTDSSSLEMRFLNTAVYSYLPVVWELQSPIREERYADHILSMKSETNIKPYNKKPSRVTKSTRYNKYGTKTGTYELTERWTEDSVPTYYVMKDVSYLEGDSVLEVNESRSWSTDTAGVRHMTITREERLYDSSISQTLYAKKTVITDGIEKIYKDEQWVIEETENGKKAHLLYKDELVPTERNICITDSNNVFRSVGRYTIYFEKHTWNRYDDRYNVLFTCDSMQIESAYTDSIEWEGRQYPTTKYRPAWGSYSRKEYVYAEDNSVTHEKEYTHGFIDTWYLTKEKLVTDEYTWTMSVNTKDTTRTTSKKFTNGWDSESTKEKWDISSMKWEITESSKYVVTFDMTGEPVSAVSASTSNNNTRTDRSYYVFHRWDEAEQRYVCQEVAWSRYDTADLYSDEVIHPYDCEDYTYYNRKGEYLGYFFNCTSHYLPITDKSVNGLYNKYHYDIQGRVDTLFRYAFYGEWYLVRYYTYEYFPDGDSSVVALRHSYSMDDNIEDWMEFYQDYTPWDYKWYGNVWRGLLAGEDTLRAPLHEMRYLGATTYSHTFSTYNDDGVLLETRTYRDGSMTPVTQTHNTFSYDAEGRVAVHVAYKDSVPDTKKIYFYSEQTGEQTACITWSGYNKETGAWSKFAFANGGEHITDGEGRIVALTNYAASADSTGIVPAERYEYFYEAGEKDWILSDKYTWQETEWVCAAPTYRGKELKPYMFDEDGNMVSRAARQTTCDGLVDAEAWSFSYGSPMSQYSLLSPQTYGVAEATLASVFTNEDWLARPLEAYYTNVSAGGALNYTMSFRYTAQREEPVTFREPVTVEPEEESAFFTWPKVDGATGYSLTIWADEAHTVKLCTILFDAKGTVLAIDFSHMPARNQLSAISYQYSAIPSVALWQTEFSHRIEDLSPGTTYWYTLTASGEQGGILDSRSGSFRTLGESGTTTGIEDVHSNDVRCTKVLRDGQIYILREGRMYDVRGNRIK